MKHQKKAVKPANTEIRKGKGKGLPTRLYTNRWYPTWILQQLKGDLPATFLMVWLLRKWLPKKSDRRKKYGLHYVRPSTGDRCGRKYFPAMDTRGCEVWARKRPPVVARHRGPNYRREYCMSSWRQWNKDNCGWSRDKLRRAVEVASRYFRFEERNGKVYASVKLDEMIELCEQGTGWNLQRMKKAIRRKQAETRHPNNTAFRHGWAELYQIRNAIHYLEHVQVKHREFHKCHKDEVAAALYSWMRYLNNVVFKEKTWWFHSRETFAKELGMSSKTIDRKMQLLRQWGLVEWKWKHDFRGDRKVLQYHLK